MSKKCVVLLSGGIDSAVVAAMLKNEGYELFTLTFDYGQRNIGEVIAARVLSRSLDVKFHKELTIQNVSSKSALLDRTQEVPKDRSIEEIESGIAPTYVPARNTIFLSYALGWAEIVGANYIGIGAVGDKSVTTMMPDCEPEYFEAFERMANLATKAAMEDGKRIQILTPIIDMLHEDVYKKGLELGIDLWDTISCYDPISRVLACGRCDACILRKKGFELAGLQDRTRYGIRK